MASAKSLSLSAVPANSNMIGSNVVYKTKLCDDKILKLKQRIAPHCREDSLIYQLRSDCTMRSLPGSFIPVFTVSINKWHLKTIDVKAVILRKDVAECDIFVMSPY